MAETATRGKARSAAAREESRSEASIPALRVRYYRRMKLQRVYAVEVAWQKSDRPIRGAGKEVTVRLIGAGAQVLPSEQTMDAAQPDGKAIFYVTPLAKGWLRNFNLEVLAQGRKVQEIPLAGKVVSQRLTWILLFLTFFVPWFLVEFVKESSLGREIGTPDGRKIYEPIAPEVEKYLRDSVPSNPDLIKGTGVDAALVDARKMFAEGYASFVQVTRIEPIAFYAGSVLFGLTLLSAFFHRQARRKAVGKPIPLGALRPRDEEEE